MGGEDPAARACRQTHKVLRVTRPVSPQARGSPARLAHPANTGTTFPPVPGVPSSRFTLWREGHAPDPVGWPGQEQSPAAGRQCPAKVAGSEQRLTRPAGTPLPAPPHWRRGPCRGVGGPEAGPALLTASLGPRPKHKGGTCPLAPFPPQAAHRRLPAGRVRARGGTHTPFFTQRVSQLHPRCTMPPGPHSSLWPVTFCHMAADTACPPGAST